MRQLKTARARFLVENLDLEEATGVPGARWEYFQIAHLEDDQTFRIENKSRQVAWSWLVAAEAVAVALLDTAGTVFQSISLQEAQEKIRYAKNVIGALPPGMQPRLITDNKTEIEFDSGARLISLPGTPQRGKARMNFVFDEYAHTKRDRELYTAALPVISKGVGRRLRIGSSPMGAGGRFWEIFTESVRKYPGYNRKITPWWTVHSFCTNVKQAIKWAPGMETAARVDLFGNDRIKAIYANMPIEDFQQEYECLFVDENLSWITWEEIRTVQDPALVCIMANSRDSRIDSALAAVDQIMAAIEAEKIEGALVAGVDVGRTRNATEIFIGGITTINSYPLRATITLENCDFDSQIAVLKKVTDVLPLATMLIDQNGIGRQLAETMETAAPGVVQGVNFTMQSKTQWATNAKKLIQQQKTPLPSDRDVAYQIHSIKKKITGSKNTVFDTDANEKHHADKFWAWALMLEAATAGGPPAAGEIVDIDPSEYLPEREKRGILH